MKFQPVTSIFVVVFCWLK